MFEKIVVFESAWKGVCICTSYVLEGGDFAECWLVPSRLCVHHWGISSDKLCSGRAEKKHMGKEVLALCREITHGLL